MPATSLMGYEVQTTGTNSGTWGDVLNDNVIQYIDSNFAGITTLSLSSSNVALTAAQARTQMIRCTGTLTGNVVISPDAGVLWNGIRCVENLTSGSFTVTLQNAGGSVVIPQSRRALVFIDTSNGPRIIGIAGSSSADPIPVGTDMLFYENAAPTGWSAVALNDIGLKVVSSSGGVTSGSVAYSTLFGRTTTDSHALTLAQIPAHTHTTNAGATLGINTDNQSQCPIFAAGTASGSAGGGDGHTHPIDMRVQTAAVLICTKS